MTKCLLKDSGERDRELCSLGVTELRRLYRARELSPVEVTRVTLERIERLNPELNAYISVIADSALAEAKAAELLMTRGIYLGPLHGVPVSVKDIIRVRDTRTTAGSRVLEHAPLDEEDAVVVQRLRAAGSILLGKTNLYEFAFGLPGPDTAFGDVQNPRKVGHQAGGSSSGSAAAVAAGLGVCSLGTDTGGSIRHPANVCGVVGLTATYGLVPTRGVIPVSERLDRVGPITRSVADAAFCLSAIAGHDAQDPHSVLAPVPDYVSILNREIRGLRLGIPTNVFYQFGHRAVLAKVEEAHDALAALGLTRVPLELPRAEETNQLADTLMTVDLLAHHEQYVTCRSRYGQNFVERSTLGRRVSGVEYAKALEARTAIRRNWQALFDRADILALPGNTAGAPRHGEDTIEVDGQAYPARLVTSRFTRATSLIGFPTLVIPVAETLEGLPIGIQLVGPPLGEARLLAVGHALESALGDLAGRWGIDPR